MTSCIREWEKGIEGFHFYLGQTGIRRKTDEVDMIFSLFVQLACCSIVQNICSIVVFSVT